MKDIASLHRAEYGVAPDIIAAAPGVVKFLGEHTDVAEGVVLAVAISFEVHVAVSFRRDSSLRFFAADFDERKRTTIGNLKYKREDRWANYPKAVLDFLMADGVPGKGVNFTISGDVPIGLGLGSSAALGLASSLALRSLFGFPIKSDEIADTARRAEAGFFDHLVPVYEHLAAIAPAGDTASIIDIRTGRRRAIPFLDGDYKIILTDSKVPRLSVDTELRQRTDDCKKCIALLSQGGGRNLREYSSNDIEELMGVLPESVRRRCLHIVDEIARVGEAEEALVKGDFPAFGRAVNKSHASLRNLFEVSCPEIDWLAKRAIEIEGVLCSRLTGRGFGGCTVSIMKEAALNDYRKRLEEYERIFGFRPTIFEATLTGGLRLLG
jgi:galactokinase